MNNSHIVIFDGVCNFCNGAVNFIIKRDPGSKFVFTPMQSELAKELMLKYQVENVGIDTFLLIKDGRCFMFSSAALEITKDLSGFWCLSLVFKIVPAKIRDFFYKVFARNRYNLFGRKATCMVPTNDVKSRFIGV
jgi:predicted DCC family thiol-disulfide oxidoreductase YuxK